MNKYSLSLFLILGLIFITPAGAQYEITTVDTTPTSSVPGSTSEEDDSSSGWIRDSQPWGGTSTEPETTGIEHEDIGITGGDEPTSTAPEYDDAGRIIRQVGPSGEEIDYNESDLDFVTRLVRSGSVYLKYDGVEGEAVFEGDPDRPIITGNVPSGSSTEGGKAETTWKVEKGAKGKTSGEMVIKGSNIKENDEVGQILASGEGIPGAGDVDTLEDLAMYASKVVYDNGGFNEIRMDDASLVLRYNHRIKYFGFWERTMDAEVHITFGDGEHGRVKVKFPWTHVFGRKTVKASDIVSAYEASEGELDLNNSARTHAEILSTLSKIAHDTAMAVIRKIG